MAITTLEDVEHVVNKARDTYRRDRDPGAKSIESAETRINATTPAPVLSAAERAGFLRRPAGTSHYYIALAKLGNA